MKHFLKIFLISFVCFLTLFSSAIYAFVCFKPQPVAVMPQTAVASEEKDLTEEEPENQYERVNILVFGTEGMRADTIMLVSYEVSSQTIDIISVPRDTYNYVEGHGGKAQKKINAVYGLGSGDGGPSGMKQQIANLLGVPVHYFVRVDYDGVKAIIDLIGGVEVDVHRKMYYDDPRATPPLHIHFDKGPQLLNGQKSLEYLRWRKNNDGSGGETGDIGRIGRQQAFLLSAMKQAIGPNLPAVLTKSFEYIETDMGLSDIIYYADKLASYKELEINTHRLPEKKITYYYIHDAEKTKEMMDQIYALEKADSPNSETEEQ